MKTRILFLLGFLFCATVNAQLKYAVSSIDSSLLIDAKVVVRNHDEIYTINGNASMEVEKSYAETVLTPSASNWVSVRINYDAFIDISKIEINIYNKEGLLYKSIKKSALEDLSYYDGTHVGDERFYYFDASNYKTPFTVEVSYVEKHKDVYGIPQWIPQFNTDVSVEKASIKFNVLENNLRSKALNLPDNAKVGENSWEVTNLKAIKYEENMPPFYKVAPMVFFSVENFKYDKVSGSFDDWESLGKWKYQINESLEPLPQDALDMVEKIKLEHKTTPEIVEGIYDYLQKNSRYVSVQLGIGGWRPFSPTYVHEKGYGDCKALTNYTRNLLKAADIEAYYSVIGSGIPSFFLEDFATVYGQSNHVILCVPNEGDTIWLECTSQSFPTGYLGEGNANRNVLLVTEQGGKIVRTPKYDWHFNNKTEVNKVTINSDGSARIVSEADWQGSFYRSIASLLKDNEKEVERAIAHWLQHATPTIHTNKITEAKTDTPKITHQLDVEFPKYGKKIGSRLLLPINGISTEVGAIMEDKKRKTDIYVDSEYSLNKEHVFTIPAGFVIDKLPKDIDLETPYGSYHFHSTTNGNTITFKSEVKILEGTFPAAEYDDWYTFMKQVYNQEHSKMMIKKSS